MGRPGAAFPADGRRPPRPQAGARDIDRLAADLSFGVARLARHLRLRRRATHTLTMSQISILSVLSQNGPMTLSALAEAERVQSPSITRSIQALDAAGLITRVSHPSSTRTISLAVTAAGIDTLAADAHARDDWLRARLAHLTPQDRDTLRAATLLIAAILEAELQ